MNSHSAPLLSVSIQTNDQNSFTPVIEEILKSDQFPNRKDLAKQIKKLTDEALNCQFTNVQIDSLITEIRNLLSTIAAYNNKKSIISDSEKDPSSSMEVFTTNVIRLFEQSPKYIHLHNRIGSTTTAVSGFLCGLVGYVFGIGATSLDDSYLIFIGNAMLGMSAGAVLGLIYGCFLDSAEEKCLKTRMKRQVKSAVENMTQSIKCLKSQSFLHHKVVNQPREEKSLELVPKIT